jgi:hypothetical protein
MLDRKDELNIQAQICESFGKGVIAWHSSFSGCLVCEVWLLCEESTLYSVFRHLATEYSRLQ